MAKIVTFIVIALGVLGIFVLGAWIIIRFLDWFWGLGRAFLRSQRGAVLSIDPRLADTSQSARLRKVADAISRYTPLPTLTLPPTPAPYRSILGFLPVDKVPGLDDPNDFMFFDTPVAREGYLAYQHLAPNQHVSSTPLLADLKTLCMPDERPDRLLLEALSLRRQYPGPQPNAASLEVVPDFGAVPPFQVPRPDLDLPLIGSGPMRVFNGWIESAYRAEIEAVEKAWKAWEGAKDEHEAAAKEVELRAAALRSKIASLNAQQSAAAREAHASFSRAQADWSARDTEERQYIRTLLDYWQEAFLDSPEALAQLTLDHLLVPRWLPKSFASKYDHETGILVVEAEFPDVGQLHWQKPSDGKVKLANKTEARDAGERLYPALAMRYAWELARSANENLVRAIGLNGWADYVDRATGETSGPTSAA